MTPTSLKDPNFLTTLLIAGALDLFDYLIIGFIPIFGDIIDLAGVAIMYTRVGPYALIGLGELVPILGDLAPSFLLSVLASKMFRAKE